MTGDLVVGVGARRGVTAAELAELVDAALHAVDGQVRALATVEGKETEPGIAQLAAARGWPVIVHPAAELAAQNVPNPSAAALTATGTPSVAEAAAICGGGVLTVPKRTSTRAAVAVARHPDLRHHGDRDTAPGLVDLAVNVRHGAQPAWLTSRLADAMTNLAAYPDGRAAREAVAARHGRDPASVLLTAGAAEAFVLLARVLRPRRAVVVHPQFTEPEAALRAAGHPVGRVVLTVDAGFTLDPARVPEDADLVVIGNPTNPTSVLHPAATLAALARPGRTLVVDEAFADTIPREPESLASRDDLPGVVVIRSLTKTWGLAGLRVGYVLADPPLIRVLGGAQPLWPVSAPALAAAEACATREAAETAEEYARTLEAERDHLLGELACVPGVRVAGRPRSSFVLIKVPGGARVRAALRTAGYAVRRGDTFPGLGPDWLRVAVRDRATSRQFAAALATVITPGARRGGGASLDDGTQLEGLR
jgi:histidinol-phosphate aminotransferase